MGSSTSSNQQSLTTANSTCFAPKVFKYCQTCEQPKTNHAEENLNHGCVYFREMEVVSSDSFFDKECKKCQKPRRQHLPYANDLQENVRLSCQWEV